MGARARKARHAPVFYRSEGQSSETANRRGAAHILFRLHDARAYTCTHVHTRARTPAQQIHMQCNTRARARAHTPTRILIYCPYVVRAAATPRKGALVFPPRPNLTYLPLLCLVSLRLQPAADPPSPPLPSVGAPPSRCADGWSAYNTAATYRRATEYGVRESRRERRETAHRRRRSCLAGRSGRSRSAANLEIVERRRGKPQWYVNTPVVLCASPSLSRRLYERVILCLFGRQSDRRESVRLSSYAHLERCERSYLP